MSDDLKQTVLEISEKMRIEKGDTIIIRYTRDTPVERIKQVILSLRMLFDALGHNRSTALFLDASMSIEKIPELYLNQLGYFKDLEKQKVQGVTLLSLEYGQKLQEDNKNISGGELNA